MRRPLRLTLVVLGLVLAYVLIRGLRLARYEPERSEGYVWGSFHVHSDLSDGLAPLETIAAEAREAGVSFLVLTDHGSPHPEAAIVDTTYQGVRVIGGSEVGIPEGHIIVADVDGVPNYKLPPYPPDSIADIHDWGGFAVLTYPEDPVHAWRYWEDDLRPNGIEIINVTSYFRVSTSWEKLDWIVFSLFNRLYYLHGFTAPTYALERWDELLENGPVFGYYASNAHGGFPLTETLTIGVPSYRTAFSFVGLAVDPHHRDDPTTALRTGQFFAVVRGAGEPHRFEFTGHRDGTDYPMGSVIGNGSTLEVVLDAGQLSPRIVLKRDGTSLEDVRASKLVHNATKPGAYRVEVYLDEHPLLSPNVPWILSNPIFVDPSWPEGGTEPMCESAEPIALEELRIEKDEASDAATRVLDSGALELSYRLSQATPDKVDRWVALSLRKEMDLSSYRGVLVEARVPETMRYWFEVRAGDRAHYASVKLVAGVHNRVFVPWGRFYEMLGLRTSLPLSELDAFFITVNTSNSVTGFDTELVIETLGWCQ